MQSTRWIGRTAQEILVFDPLLQLEDCPHVFLWSKTRGLQKFIAAQLRPQIATLRDPELRATVLAKFDAWIAATDIEGLLASERMYYVARKKREAADQARQRERAALLEQQAAHGRYTSRTFSDAAREEDFEHAAAAKEFDAQVAVHWDCIEAAIGHDPDYRAALKRQPEPELNLGDYYDLGDLSDRYE